MIIQLYNTIYWTDCSFPVENSWLPCRRVVDYVQRYVGFISGILIQFNSIWSTCLFLKPVLYCSDYFSFAVCLKSDSVMPPALVFVLRGWELFQFHTNVRIVFLSVWEMPSVWWGLHWMMICGHMNTLAILILAIPENRVYLHFLVSSSISCMTVIIFRVQIFQVFKS